MLRLKLSASFRKELQLAEARGRDVVSLRPAVEILLNRRPLPPQYQDHPLRGKWKGHREFHLQGDWIVIYRVEDDGSLILVRTGTHADLFKK